jgi:sarcosine oxidase
MYTTTRDEAFILEGRGRIVVGSPCSGHGFKFAPAIGERLADLAVEAA